MSDLDLLLGNEEPKLPGSQIMGGLDFQYSNASLPYKSLIDAAEEKYGLLRGLLPRMIHQESSFVPTKVSPKGALGIAQIMPQYHPGVNPWNPTEAIDYAGNLLKKHYDYFGDWEKAAASYNAGAKRVESGNLPAETVDYITKVFGKAPSITRQPTELSELELLTGPTPPPAPPKEQPVIQAPNPPGGWNEAGQPLNSSGVPYPFMFKPGKGINTTMVVPLVGVMSPTELPKKVADQKIGSTLFKGAISAPMTVLNTAAGFVTWPINLAAGLSTYLTYISEGYDHDVAKHIADKTVAEIDKYIPRLPNTDVGRMQEEILASPLGWPKAASKWVADVTGLKSIMPKIPGKAGEVIDHLFEVAGDFLSAGLTMHIVGGTPKIIVKGGELLQSKTIAKDLNTRGAEVKAIKESGGLTQEEIAATQEKLKATQETQAKLDEELAAKKAAAEAKKIAKKEQTELELLESQPMEQPLEQPVEPSPAVEPIVEPTPVEAPAKPMTGAERARAKKAAPLEPTIEEAPIELPAVDQATLSEMELLTKQTGLDLFGLGKKEPITDLDLQTGTPLPEALSTDKNPFRETDPEVTTKKNELYSGLKSVANKFDDLFNNPTKPYRSPETTTSKLINDVNRWLDGDNTVDIAKTRDMLSEMAARANELKPEFSMDLDHKNWANNTSEAAVWARGADRAAKPTEPISLYSGIPVDKIPEFIRDLKNRLAKIYYRDHNLSSTGFLLDDGRTIDLMEKVVGGYESIPHHEALLDVLTETELKAVGGRLREGDTTIVDDFLKTGAIRYVRESDDAISLELGSKPTDIQLDILRKNVPSDATVYLDFSDKSVRTTFDKFEKVVNDYFDQADRVKIERTPGTTRLNIAIPLDEIPEMVRNLISKLKLSAPRIEDLGGRFRVHYDDLYRNKEILDKTGYWLGKDNMWRYELDDSKMRVKGYDYQAKGPTPITNLIDFPKLFEDVPAARELVITVKPGLSVEGRFTSGSYSIEVRTLLRRDVLLHEIQHAVNDIVGSRFTGTNPEYEGIALVNEVLARMRKVAKSSEIIKAIDETRTNPEFTGKPREALQSVLEKAYNTDEYQKLVDIVTSSETSFQRYLKNEGEMEARLSKARMDMSNAQRKAEPPWETLEKMLVDEGLQSVENVPGGIGTKLYSGTPDFKDMADAIIKLGKSFTKAMEKDEQGGGIKFGDEYRKLKRAFVRSYGERSGNVRQDLINYSKLGERVMEKMYLQAGGHPMATEMFKQMKKETSAGLSRDLKKIYNRLTMAERMIDIGKYKTPQQYNFPPGKTPEESAVFKQLFMKKSINGIRDLTPAEAYDLLHTNEDGTLGGRVGTYFNWQRKAVEYAHDREFSGGGLITSKERDALIAHNYRRTELLEDIFDKSTELTLGGKKITVNDSGIQRLQHGTKADIYNADSDMMALETFNRLISRAYRNRALEKLHELATTDPENPFARVKTSKEVKIPPEFTVNVVKYYRDGKPINIFLSPDVAREWISSNAETTMRYAQTVRYLSVAPLVRTFATGTSWTFALRNLPRDIMQIWFTARIMRDKPHPIFGKYESVYNPILPVAAIQMTKDMASTFRDALLRKGRYQDYIYDGGGQDLLTTQGRIMQRKIRFDFKERKLKITNRDLDSAVSRFQDFMGYPGTTSEIMTRLATRDRVIENRAREKGITYEEAAKNKEIREEATFAALDYMNFHQGGNITKAFDNGFPYLNARIVAARGFTRALFKDQPVVTMLKLAQFAALTTGLYIGNQYLHPETMAALENDQRLVGNLAFPLGDSFAIIDSRGHKRYPFVVLPIDQGMAPFKAMFEVGSDIWLGNPARPKRILDAIGQLSPVDIGMLPPSVSGIYGYEFNKNFWSGEAIREEGKIFKYQVPKWFTGQELGGSEEEYMPGKTPQALIDLGAATGLSPERMKYLVGQMITNDNMFAQLLGVPYNRAFSQLPTVERDVSWTEALANTYGIRAFFKLTNPYTANVQIIDENKERGEIRIYSENRGLDVRVNGYLYDGNYSRHDVERYINKFKDEETQDRLRSRFEFRIATKGLDVFWTDLKSIPDTESRARAYVEKMNHVSPEEYARLKHEQGKIEDIGGVLTEGFWDHVSQIRRGR